METKSKEKRPGDDKAPVESSSMSAPGDQVIEQVPGATDTMSPAAITPELTEAENHRPICSPVSQISMRRESMGTTAETDPIVDASFANVASLRDDREFWGAVARSLGPLILNTVKHTGKIAVGGLKKLNPTLTSMLQMEGFSESAIQQLESGQQESGANGSGADQREFWGAIVGSVVPVLMPHAKKFAGAAFRKIFESGSQDSAADTQLSSQQLEAMFIQQVESGQQESGAIISADQREFWNFISRRIVPALTPVAKAVTGAAAQAGKTLVTGGVKKLSSTLATMLRLEGFSETAIQQLESGQQESGGNGSGADQREFWGAIVGSLVPVLMPHAKKYAGKAFKRIFESSQQESGAETQAVARQLEAMMIQHVASGQQESGASLSADQREFWGAIASALAPALAPVAKAAAGAAFNAGSSWVKSIFESSQQESGAETQALAQQLEAMFIQQAESGQKESGASGSDGDQKEFWRAIARRIVPALAPVVKSVASAGLQAGTTLATGGINKLSSTLATMLRLEGFSETAIQQLESGQQESGAISSEREFWPAIVSSLVPVLMPHAKRYAGAAYKRIFESSQQESGAESQGMSQQLEAVFIQQVESDYQKSGGMGLSSDQREFWRGIAGKIVPALAPVAKAAAGAAVQAGTTLATGGIKKLSSTLAAMLRLEGFSETAIQQLESAQQVSGGDGLDGGQREFWGSIAGALVPVFKPVAKKLAGAAIKTGSSWAMKFFESSQQESGTDTHALSQQLEAMFIQQLGSGQQESTADSLPADQREFWGAIARTLAPMLAPVAKIAADAAVKTGTALATGGVKKLSSSLATMLRLEGYSETAIQQLEAQEGSGSKDSGADQQEFWRSVARRLVPVLKPVAQKLGSVAIDAGGSLVTSSIKKLMKSHQESGGSVIREAFGEELSVMEVIIGTDDRMQVTNTTDDPYRRICHLSIQAGDGSAFLGTGFFIGPRTIITAGHCVYDRDHGGWPQQIIVSPGRNVSDKPFDQFVATNFCSVQGWTENQDRDCDYGVIKLGKNDNISPQIGSFGFGIFSDQALMNKQLNVTGYPGDKPSGTLMTHSRTAIAVTPTTIVYDIDTVGGQSGSAVYDENNCVVAIHTNGNFAGNSGTRISQAVFNNLNNWRLEGGAS